MNRIRRQGKTLGMVTFALAALTLFAGAVRPAQGQTFNLLYTFQGQNANDGAYPNGILQGTNGYLYGTTGAGGAGSDSGTIYKINTSGSPYSVLYTFDTQAGDPDGQGNNANLVLASNGYFYGTTQGNSGGCSAGFGDCGVLYKIASTGGITILHNFCSVISASDVCLDGVNPEATMVQAANGDLYGTTRDGGTYNHGTIFKATLDGKLTTLHSFCATLTQNGYCTDGTQFFSPLIQGSDGNLYGTTTSGGTGNYGTFYRITPAGKFTTLYNFCSLANCADGGDPSGALAEAANGSFYGTASTGGTAEFGMIFNITTSGALTPVYSFCTVVDCPDGNAPNGVILGTDDNLYGVASSGGSENYGTLYQVTPSTGALTVLHSFQGTDGLGNGTLMQDTSGTFYGTMFNGGAGWPNCNLCVGTIFSLSMKLGPFVETLPTSGKVDTAVKILGSNLKGATAVTFNGTAATFTVVSNTEITTTVPEGATTGEVEVTTSKGKPLTSNLVFQVP